MGTEIKRRRERGLGFGLVVLLAALGVGCGEGAEEAALRIAMIPKLVGIGYFEATELGARQAAQELNVELVYDGPTEARTEDQIKMIDGWLAQGFDVIAVAPNDPEAISRTLRNAGETGALVLTWDTDANPELSKRSLFREPGAQSGHRLHPGGVDGRRNPGTGRVLAGGLPHRQRNSHRLEPEHLDEVHAGTDPGEVP